VLAVALGATVEFRNEDDSLSQRLFALEAQRLRPRASTSRGVGREQVFNTPGPVNLLCNIHSSMGGWVYVVRLSVFRAG
jgi:plastocyanin